MLVETKTPVTKELTPKQIIEAYLADPIKVKKTESASSSKRRGDWLVCTRIVSYDNIREFYRRIRHVKTFTDDLETRLLAKAYIGSLRDDVRKYMSSTVDITVTWEPKNKRKLKKYGRYLYSTGLMKKNSIPHYHTLTQKQKRDALLKVMRLAKDEIQAIRKQIITKRTVGKKWAIPTDDEERPYYFRYYLVGGVLSEPGVIMDMMDFKKLHAKAIKPKTPSTDEHHVGVEIEFCAPVTFENLVKKMNEHNLIHYCQWMQENSLRAKFNETPHEVTILGTESHICRIVGQVGHMMQEIKAAVEDRGCGLHIHLDARHRDPKRLYANLVSCQHLLRDMMPDHRRSNRFCTPNTTKDFPESTQERQSGYNDWRYNMINAHAYFQHRTIEIRIHEGTVDAEEINNWIRLLTKIAAYSNILKKDITTIDQFASTFVGLHDEYTLAYIQKRLDMWKPKKEKKTPDVLGVSPLEAERWSSSNSSMDEVNRYLEQLAANLGSQR